MRIAHRTRAVQGFTLVELLVSIAILALLIGLTVKGVRKFREAAWAADTQNELSTIANAIQAYHATFHAYPGPIPNRTVGATAANTTYGIKFPNVSDPTGQFDVTADLAKITGSENLVLGLYGGLVYNAIVDTNPYYDPSAVGRGPSSLNPLSPKKYGAFLENQNLLSWHTVTGKKSGKFQDESGQANDTIVPEIVDRFPQGLPILYLRSDSGAAWNVGLAATPTDEINNVITKDTDDNPATHVAQYHLKHIKGYTATTIGESKHAISGNTAHGLQSVDITKTLTGDGPYDAYPYLVNPALSTAEQPGKPGSGHVARKKDDFILISPGVDRIYGTKDDITNFGSVNE